MAIKFVGVSESPIEHKRSGDYELEHRDAEHEHKSGQNKALPDDNNAVARMSAIPSGIDARWCMHSGGAPLRGNPRLPYMIPSGSICNEIVVGTMKSQALGRRHEDAFEETRTCIAFDLLEGESQ